MKKSVCKKWLSVILVTFIAFQGITYSNTVVLHASSEIASVEALSASSSSNGQVSISGNITTGAGQMITVKVINPNNGLDYIDQTESTEGGYFEFTYTNDSMIDDGLYRVLVSANGESQPTSTTFKFEAKSSNGNSNNNKNNSNDNNDENTQMDDSSKEEIKKVNGNVEIQLPQPQFNYNKKEAKSKVTSETITESFELVDEDSKGIKRVIIEFPEVVGAKSYKVELPKDQLMNGTSHKVIELKTQVGTVTLPTNMIADFDDDGSEEITIGISQSVNDVIKSEALNDIGERPIVDVDVVINDRVIDWENKNAPITIAIPYNPMEEELRNLEHIIICYINEQGQEISIPNGRYDVSKGAVIFQTKHLSKFAVAYVTKSFKDLEAYEWVDNEIAILASKGIINGTSEDIFSPSENIKRADFISLLVRTLELDADFENNFSDVSSESYYYEAVGIAKSLGITEGIGNNQFEPDASISRQDMMVLTERALRIAGIELNDGNAMTLMSFDDRHHISSYAENSIATLINEGIILGDGDNIYPDDKTTRAETASLIYKVYKKVYY